MRALLRFLGWVVAVFGGTFVVVAVTGLVGGDEKTGTDVLLGMTVFFGGITYGGVRLIVKNRAQKEAGHADTDELVALKAARAVGGTIGAAELAASAGMPFAHAKTTLDALVRQGACQLVVTEAGTELYRFPDLALSPGQAARARDVVQ